MTVTAGMADWSPVTAVLVVNVAAFAQRELAVTTVVWTGSVLAGSEVGCATVSVLASAAVTGAQAQEHGGCGATQGLLAGAAQSPRHLQQLNAAEAGWVLPAQEAPHDHLPLHH